MIDLNEIREKIDRIDVQIVKLIEERMDLAMDVANYKKAIGKPVYDKEREKSKLENIEQMTSKEQNRKYMAELFSQIMSVSRRSQYHMIGDNEQYIEKQYAQVDALPFTKDTKVVYQGVPGAFGEEAMIRFFGADIDGMNVAEFEDITKALENEEADYGVVPIENSSAGFVNGIYDLLAQYELNIVGEQILNIDQCLLGIQGATVKDIKTVYSHPQGLLQTKEFLDEKGWQLISMSNTAVSAKKVKEDADISQAAIASRRAAALYGLEVLVPSVNHTKDNATRFAILSKRRIYTKTANKISISFSLPHESGTLYNVLANFIFNGINMTSIESVPLLGKQWEYSFFIDFEGNLSAAEVKNALKGIREEVINFRILGNF